MKSQSDILEEADEIIRRQAERRNHPYEILVRDVMRKTRERLDAERERLDAQQPKPRQST
ncbi:hypothetical protein [Halochromatium roseum]|uniref:hypothetical protein n=1 Tax=Halochromatium roseum TaxID=391920 RepID=UPI0019134B44|nr:hypothetical protein [Halochromatium roseum]MBK5938129.1 hypothetical protein [Halochromatium roseum]